MTTVCVRNLPLLADVGINLDEVGRRQPLVITVELKLDIDRVERIGDTIDYRRIVSEAEALALVHIPLIETFAHDLGQRCLTWAAVTEARVVIDKPFALPRGLARVEVSLSRYGSQIGPSGSIRVEQADVAT